MGNRWSTVESFGQRPVEQGRLPKHRQGKEIAALLLRSRSRFEPLGELVVTSCISSKGKNGHERRKKIWINRSRVLASSGVQFCRTGLRLSSLSPGCGVHPTDAVAGPTLVRTNASNRGR